MKFLCKIGWHHWAFADTREGNAVSTWTWCERSGCPLSTPMRVNVDYLRLPPTKEDE